MNSNTAPSVVPDFRGGHSGSTSPQGSKVRPSRPRSMPSQGSGSNGLSEEQVKRLRRRLARFRKAGMFATESLNVTIERAVTVQALKEAYSLVHDAYVDKGYIRPRFGGLRVRAFEALPEMVTFVARTEGRIIAVTSLIADSPDLGLPSDHVFGDRLNFLRRQSGSVCEITNLAVAPEYRNSSVFLQLTQACFAHAWAAGFENMFVAVSPGHASFFHDFLQFEHGPQGNCSDEVEDIVEGMTLCVANGKKLAHDFDKLIGSEDAFLYDFFFAKNSHHRHIGAWKNLANRIFTDPLKLRELFIFASNLLLDCPANELDAIHRRWGDDVFWNVWGEGGSLPGSPALSPVAQTSAA